MLTERLKGWLIATKWTWLKKRSLQNWGGEPKILGLKQEPMPKYLSPLCELVTIIIAAAVW